MARIRIVDEWMRSPHAVPVQHRVIMVVAETWAEQKVLMRAYAASQDPSQPTIGLQGRLVPISPAGVDPYGPWGVHVDPPADGLAQELRVQLQQAAREVAGTKGNPPRLQDERAAEADRPTRPWAPSPRSGPPLAASSPGVPTVVPGLGLAASAPPEMPAVFPTGSTPARMRRPTARGVSQHQAAPEGRSTVFGHESPSSPVQPRRSYHHAAKPSSLAAVVGKTMPIGFALTESERNVLNALSRGATLSAAQIGEVARVKDGAAYMNALLTKLTGHGLDLIDTSGGEYRLRRG